MIDPQNLATASEWVVRYASRLQKNARVLDLACGSGRHALYLASLGLQVKALDRDTSALRAQRLPRNIEVVEADLENSPWPFGNEEFDAIIVTNYLHRPLFAPCIAALKSGGVLIYETFAVGNEKFGKPSNPDFLLRSGELLDTVHGRMRVIAYEDDYVDLPKPAMVQRICAVKA
ncbi:MAG: class I SAM-dependent methyltransferase [Burkholderiales bacterium]